MTFSPEKRAELIAPSTVAGDECACLSLRPALERRDRPHGDGARRERLALVVTGGGNGRPWQFGSLNVQIGYLLRPPPRFIRRNYRLVC